MRVILYTGKGGVGKTTLSAATALRCSELGKRTIVMSTDSAHSLADAFDIEIGKDPVKLAKNLEGLEIDVNHELSRNWGKIKDYIKEFLTSQGYEDVVAEELGIPPGVEELFSLMKLKDFQETQDYDVAVVDCAPTGGTLRMLGMTDVLEWYMERFFNLERKIIKTIRPIAERLVKAPFPRDDVYGSIENLYKRILAVKAILTDPLKTSIRLVINPERMVIRESQRAYTYLSMFGFPVDSVIANRVIPEEAKGGYMVNWRRIHKKHLAELEDCFFPLKIFSGKLFDREMVGIDSLREMARCVFGDEDPSKVFHCEKPIEMSKEDGEYVLSIKLPYTTRDQIDMWSKGDEVILTLGNFRRNLILPRVLSSLKLKKAKLEDGRFKIFFG